MKYMLLSALAISVFSAPVHSMGLLVAQCTTDKGYQVSVVNNGASLMDAEVIDPQGKTVATYQVGWYKGRHSSSFGRPTIQDADTGGRGFKLEGPSTNFKNYILEVKENAGSSEIISDQNLSCSVFGK